MYSDYFMMTIIILFILMLFLIKSIRFAIY